MDTKNTLHDYFLEAFRHSVIKEGRGIMNIISIDTKISRSHLSKVLNSIDNVKSSIKFQTKIAKYFGYSRDEFLEFGRKIIEGELVACKIRKYKTEKKDPFTDKNMSNTDRIIEMYENIGIDYQNKIIKLEDKNKILKKECHELKLKLLTI